MELLLYTQIYNYMNIYNCTQNKYFGDAEGLGGWISFLS